MQLHAQTIYKKILITGGAGFIGSYLAKKFLKFGSTVHILDNLCTGTLSNLPEHPNLHFHQGSIVDMAALDVLKEYSFDLIFHLASITGIQADTEHPYLVYETATTGTLNILSTFSNVPVVLFSSPAVYGRHNKQAVKESASMTFEELVQCDGGKLGYACGKREMEQIGLRAAQNGRKVLIIRPFNVVNKHRSSTYEMAISALINQALQGKPITISDDGFQVRSFSCIQTFIKCLCRLIEYDAVWKYGYNIVNIGSGKGYSINDLAGIVLQETKSHSLIKYHLHESYSNNHNDAICCVPDATYGEQFYGAAEWPTLRDIVKNILQHTVVKEAVQL